MFFILLQAKSFPAKIAELRIKNVLLKIIFFILTFILFWYFSSTVVCITRIWGGFQEVEEFTCMVSDCEELVGVGFY